MNHFSQTASRIATWLILATALTPSLCFAWSAGPHSEITRAAIATLPPWQQELLADEREKLARIYCLIPDNVYTDRVNGKFARMDSHPGEIYLHILHLPEQQPQNLEAIRFFLDKAVASLKAGKTADASRYMGTLCHLIEDYGSPAHTVPGDNMFTMLKQFMPPPQRLKHQLLHGPIESGDWKVNLADYHPRLLGTSVDEAAWRLLHCINDQIINARSTTIPIIQALYADDPKAVEANQLRAATVDAQTVADALYTIMCLGSDKLDATQTLPLQSMNISRLFPLEAVNLYFPQTEFSSAPNWGYSHNGFMLDGSGAETPLKLRVTTENSATIKEFADGISPSAGKKLTYLLPPGVYKRFTVLAGLHPELGADGKVEFVINGDGKPLVSATVGGAEPAHRFDCDIASVTQLQLVATSRSAKPKTSYAIWAEPVVRKE